MAEDYEEFEVSDFDLANEFAGARRGRKFTKEEQIYGVWAEAEEEEEVAAPPPRAPTMAFVSAGVQKNSANKSPSPAAPSRTPSPEPPKFVDSSDEEPEAPRSGFGAGRGRGGGRPPPMAAKLGMAKGGASIGQWERHTRGVAGKMMKKMGYMEGKGLGKDLAGIATPVEAVQRKGKAALGFYGSERSERSLKDFPVRDSDEEEKNKFEEQLNHWKKSGDKTRKVKYTYKNAQDVIKEGRGRRVAHVDHSHISKHKVIDMTGPETKVLSSYHAIAGQKSLVDSYEESRRKKFEHLDLPELIHNIQVLVDNSQDDILIANRRKEQDSDRLVHLEHEEQKLKAIVMKGKKEQDSLDSVIALLENLQSRFDEKLLTLDDAGQIFTKLYEEHPEIYVGYNLAYLGPHYLTVLLKTEALNPWNPLANPEQLKHIFRLWQRLLEGTNMNAADQPMDPYHQLCYDSWFSFMRGAINSTWDPKISQPMIDVVEAWKSPLIPNWIMDQILQQVILARLMRAVHEWNPLEDRVPIHHWLHPWLPYLSDQLRNLYPVIRKALISALVHWTPYDTSAKSVIEPWVGVFSDTHMNNLLQTSIQPKLEKMIGDMVIDPHAQNLQPWNAFVMWSDIIPVASQCDILSRAFFPKWFRVLGVWTNTQPPQDKVIHWYKGWRDLFPQKLISAPQIRQNFHKALEVCRRSFSQASEADQFGALLSSLADPPPPPPPGSPPPAPKPPQFSAAPQEPRLKDVLAARCGEKGIIFADTGRTHNGRSLYACGRHRVFFQGNLIYVRGETGEWVLCSMKTLLEDC